MGYGCLDFWHQAGYAVKLSSFYYGTIVVCSELRNSYYCLFIITNQNDYKELLTFLGEKEKQRTFGSKEWEILMLIFICYDKKSKRIMSIIIVCYLLKSYKKNEPL